mgnify:CR=1 FL=1
MRKLKVLESCFSTYGRRFGIPICCLIWFGNVNNTLRSTLPEYNETMSKLSNNEGVILCPDCVVKRLTQ